MTVLLKQHCGHIIKFTIGVILALPTGKSDFVLVNKLYKRCTGFETDC